MSLQDNPCNTGHTGVAGKPYLQSYDDDVKAALLKLNPQQAALVCKVVDYAIKLSAWRTQAAAVDRWKQMPIGPQPAAPGPQPTAPRLLVLGPGGSGKTTMAQQLDLALYAIFHRPTMVCAAPTGVAAIAHVGGKTLHSLFGLPIKDTQKAKPLPVMPEKSREAAHRWLSDAEVILFDEISMVSPLTLGHIVSRLNVILPERDDTGAFLWRRKAFIFMGDFLQLPSIGTTSMFNYAMDAAQAEPLVASVVHATSSHASASAAAGASADAADSASAKPPSSSAASTGTTGRKRKASQMSTDQTAAQIDIARQSWDFFAMAMFEKHDLVGNERAKKDPQHAAYVGRMRERLLRGERLSQRDVDHLQPLTAEEVRADPSWARAPIIVTGNEERVTFNYDQAKRNALVDNVPMFVRPLPLAASVAPETEARLRRRYPHRLQGVFVPGAAAYITTNICVMRGLANGRPVHLHSLSFEDPEVQRQYEHGLKHGKAARVERSLSWPSPPNPLTLPWMACQLTPGQRAPRWCPGQWSSQ
jgi:hypothetical protein